MTKFIKIYETIKQEVDRIPLISTHEHTLSEEEYLNNQIDLFSFIDFFDLMSSGMPPDEFQADMNPKEKWRIVKKYLKQIQTTSFFRSIFYGFRKMYGFKDDEITDNNWRDISRAITRESKREGAYRYFLKDKPVIERMILDSQRLESNDLFAPVLRFDDLLASSNFSHSKKDIEKRRGISITKIDDCLKVLDRYFEELIAGNGVGIKTANAAASYKINYDRVSKLEAQKAFDFVVKGYNVAGDGYDDRARPYDSFMMHAMVERAGSRGLPVQIHTGMQAGIYGRIDKANPIHLASLMCDHPETRFDLFHGGFPYTDELVSLGKQYPNVYPDLCWLPRVSWSFAKDFLHKLIDTVPNHKILAFGADCSIPEGTCAIALWTRKLISEVLAEKIEDGYFIKKTAVYVAKRILRDNAKDLFGI